MCVPFEVAHAVLTLANTVDDFDTSAILWVFSDFFMTYDLGSKRQLLNVPDANGALALFPYHAENAAMDAFLKHWGTLDPSEYPDLDDDRSTISLYSPYIIDSFFALSLAYQITLDEFNYEDGSIFRERAFFNLVNGVAFDGLSGSKSFNSFGDLREPIFDVMYTSVNESVFIGNVNRTSVNVDTSLFFWPDGSQGQCFFDVLRIIYFEVSFLRTQGQRPYIPRN